MSIHVHVRKYKGQKDGKTRYEQIGHVSTKILDGKTTFKEIRMLVRNMELEAMKNETRKTKK